MKRTFIIASLFTLINIAAYSADFVSYENDWMASLVEYKREITKEFSTNAEPTLKIDNLFGNIRIIEGSANKIVFKITVTGKAKNEEKAKEIADKINVRFIGNVNDVIAKTEIKSTKCSKCGRDIYYEVTVPKKTKITLKNQYGDIKLDNVYKSLDVDLQYGKLYANEVQEANLAIRFGGAKIAKSEKVKISSSYSKYNLGEIQDLSGSFKCDDISVENVGIMIAHLGYSTLNVEHVTKTLDINDFSYGTLKVMSVDKDFAQIKISAKYSKVSIAMTEHNNFKASLYTSYGSIKTGGLKFLETSIKKEDVIVGIVGTKSNPTATVNIENSYGNIVFP